ncbi:MAG: zinc-binding dehydrogenase [Polyangiales bacterium]
MSSGRVEVSGRGAARRMRYVEGPLLSPGPGEARVRVRYAGVAYGDVMRRKGVLAPPFDFTPGYDVTGEIDEVGEATPLMAGQRVAVLMPLTGFGGYAQHVIVPAAACVPIPEGVHAREALGLGLNAITALQVLTRVARVPEGGNVLVHGAAGGVGCAVLDIASQRGLRVYGTASAGKHHVVRERGGEPIDYRAVDFVSAVREQTGGRGVDVVIDGIGGEHLKKSAQALAPGGTLVALGVSGDVERGLGGVVGGLRHVLGAALRPGVRVRMYGITASPGCGPAACRADWAELMRALAAGKLRTPLIGAERALARAEQAHALLEGGSITGKVVLKA